MAMVSQRAHSDALIVNPVSTVSAFGKAASTLCHAKRANSFRAAGLGKSPQCISGFEKLLASSIVACRQEERQSSSRTVKVQAQRCVEPPSHERGTSPTPNGDANRGTGLCMALRLVDNGWLSGSCRLLYYLQMQPTNFACRHWTRGGRRMWTLISLARAAGQAVLFAICNAVSHKITFLLSGNDLNK
jgi:hypothetical protein